MFSFLSQKEEKLFGCFWVKNDCDVRQNSCVGADSFLVNNNNNTRNWTQEKHNGGGFR